MGGAALYLRAALRRAYAMPACYARPAAIALSLVVSTALTWLLRDLMFFFTLYTV